MLLNGGSDKFGDVIFIVRPTWVKQEEPRAIYDWTRSVRDSRLSETIQCSADFMSSLERIHRSGTIGIYMV